MPKKTRDVIVASSDWTVPTADGVHRRTIVKGAAWTVPVVAVAMATPAAAASKTPTLKFTKGSYTGTACNTITGVQVKRTTDGTTPDAGKTVTVTLRDGYTFANGSETFSGTTDSNGLLSLPDIKVPSTGGDSSFRATSDTLAANAPVSSTASAKTGLYVWSASDAKSSADPIPSSTNASKIVANGGSDLLVFQNPDGGLYNLAGTEIAKPNTGVDTGPGLVAVRGSGDSRMVLYKKSDGIYQYNVKDGTTTGPIANSTDAQKIVSDGGSDLLVFQDSDGVLRNLSGTIIKGTESGVSTADGLVAVRGSGATSVVVYKKADGLYQYNVSDGTTSGPVANSKDAQKIVSTAGSDLLVFQDSDGVLRNLSGTTIPGTETGVDTGTGLVAVYGSGTEASVFYKKADGIYRYNVSTGKTTGPLTNATDATKNDSKDATKIVANGGSDLFVFQTADGVLRNLSGATLSGTESNVDTGTGLVAIRGTGDSAKVVYKKSPACS